MAKAMTAKQFTDALDEMGITSHTAAAAVLGISRRSVIRYVYGTQDVPESVRRLIVMLIKHGIPKEWMWNRQPRASGEAAMALPVQERAPACATAPDAPCVAGPASRVAASCRTVPSDRIGRF